MRRIVLAVDGSDHALRAARVAGELSAGLGAEVDVLHVVDRGRAMPPEMLATYERVEHLSVTQHDLLRNVGGEHVAKAAVVVLEAGGRVRREEVLLGRPAQRVVEWADQVDADMVVAGRRGLGDVRGLLIGSVTHKIAHLTSRTLVTVE